MIQLTNDAYTKNAIAPPIMDRASIPAYAVPCFATVRPMVARATEGAAPKSPAKLLGLNKSPITEKIETTTPPITNRSTMSNISSEPALDWVQLVQFLPSRFADSLWRRDAIVENVGVLVSSRVAFKDNVKRL